jgi:hypothetical protein
MNPGLPYMFLLMEFNLWHAIYMGVSKSLRNGHLEQELQTVQLSAIRCSCIAILWVSLVSFATITLCIASQWAFIVCKRIFHYLLSLETFGYTLKYKVLSGNPRYVNLLQHIGNISQVETYVGTHFPALYIYQTRCGKFVGTTTIVLLTILQNVTRVQKIVYKWNIHEQ